LLKDGALYEGGLLLLAIIEAGGLFSTADGVQDPVAVPELFVTPWPNKVGVAGSVSKK